MGISLGPNLWCGCAYRRYLRRWANRRTGALTRLRAARGRARAYAHACDARALGRAGARACMGGRVPARPRVAGALGREARTRSMAGARARGHVRELGRMHARAGARARVLSARVGAGAGGHGARARVGWAARARATAARAGWQGGPAALDEICATAECGGVRSPFSVKTLGRRPPRSGRQEGSKAALSGPPLFSRPDIDFGSVLLAIAWMERRLIRLNLAWPDFAQICAI